MNKTKFIIFDMDGLLFDTETLGYRAMTKAMGELGQSYSLDTYKKLIGAGQKEDQLILESIYGNEFPYETITKKTSIYFEDILETEGIGIMAGVHELLDVLDEKEIGRCIASSSSLERIAQFLSMSDLTERFDFYLSGDEVARGKPHPDIFLEACRRANAEAKQALVFEDSLNGLTAAYRAGIRCVLVPDLIDPTEEMENMAYRTVSSLNDFIKLNLV